MERMTKTFSTIGLLAGCLLLCAIAPGDTPADQPPLPADATYQAYTATMEKAQAQFRETLGPAKKVRDQKIKDAETSYKPAEDRAAQALQNAKKKALADAVATYDARIKEATKKGDLEGAIAIKATKGRLIAAAEAEDTTPTDDSSVTADSQPQSTLPAWNVGTTGGNSSGNIDGIEVPEVPHHITLRFRAALQGSADSNGDIIITDPAGKSSKVWHWQPSMSLPVLNSRDILPSSVAKTKLISVDVSSFVREKGLYQIKFQYTSGDAAFSVWGAGFVSN